MRLTTMEHECWRSHPCEAEAAKEEPPGRSRRLRPWLADSRMQADWCRSPPTREPKEVIQRKRCSSGEVWAAVPGCWRPGAKTCPKLYRTDHTLFKCNRSRALVPSNFRSSLRAYRPATPPGADLHCSGRKAQAPPGLICLASQKYETDTF